LKKLANNQKGFILIVSALAVMVVLGLSAVFFLRSVGEKRVVDVEKFIMQAEFLAEAGANHGLSELKKRIGSDLSTNVQEKISSAATLDSYYTNGDSLGFLRDYAYATESTQFSIFPGEATLTLTPLSMVTDVSGNYSAQIVITEAAEPEKTAETAQDAEYIFYYNYTIKGAGTSTAVTPNIVKRVYLSGDFSVRVERDNLAKYALFTNHHSAVSGTSIWFTHNTNFYGPVRTNEALRFIDNPGSYFGGKVSQHEDKAWFYHSPQTLDDDHYGTWDVPIFNDGFDRGVGEVNLQSSVNSASAKYQALGGTTEPSANGIYLPNSSGKLLGGIYVKGVVTELTLEVDSGKPKYVIRQGTGAPTRITIDYSTPAAPTTSVKYPSNDTPTVYNGVPDGISNEGIIIYATDQISKLGGTVQKDSVVTLCSEDDIIITNHLKYEKYNTTPILNATGYTNMLGVVSFNGNVRIGTAAPNNINIHGIIMAPNGQFQVDNYSWGGSRGTATLLGGVISNYYGGFGTFGGSGYARNFVHDGRVLSGQIPPYFLSMTNFVSYDEGLDSRPLWRKVETVEDTGEDETGGGAPTGIMEDAGPLYEK